MPTHGEFRGRKQRVDEGGVSAVNAGNVEGMVFANNIVRALLSVCSLVTIGQVVAGQTLVSCDSGTVENRQGGWKSTHVNLVGRQTRRRADRIVVCELDVMVLQSQPSCRSLTTIAIIWVIVWFTRSTPPLPFG